MRKSPTLAERVCKSCGCTYVPTGTSQMFCISCKEARSKARKLDYYHRKFPNAKPKSKCTAPCCVCGGEFACHINGKPYCNTHYLRLKLYGDTELRGRTRTNTYETLGDIAHVITKSGVVITIDSSDLEAVKRYSWCISNGYAVANNGNCVVGLHRFLLNPQKGNVVDHINGNPLDNRRCNLRECTQKENSRNTKPTYNSKTGIVGVKVVKSGKYVAQIMVDRKLIYLGTFATLEAAFDARKSAEHKYFADYAPTTSRKG